ncbi:MAG TPA: EamA family transporter [Pseudoalteromonas prydzensis]|uniref:EamA family transporter n=1 Tax=Pseudoalteromonas prydzensis TaxID=182141 RepID=A0A7V1CWY1_9GAMM|nr:EamA family transporter [Pseudoalteromonas prydzensis]HEA15843.1 EamA family transporter [Pseudoalteromonas prydzensis]
MSTSFGVLAIFLWGALALLGNLTKSLPAFQLLFMCFFVSFLLLFIKRLVSKQPLLTQPTLGKAQTIIGITGLFGFHFCYFMALKYAPLIEVSLIVYLWPLLLGVFVAQSKHKINAILGGLVGFIGIVFLISDGSGFAANSQYFLGYLFASSCALLWSSYSWLMTRFDNHVDDIGWLSLYVAILALLAHIFFEQTVTGFSLSQAVGILLLGLGPVGGAFYLWDIALKRGNKTLLASLSFLTPLLSTLLLVLAQQIHFSWSILIALAFVFTGAAISNYKCRPKAVNARHL